MNTVSRFRMRRLMAIWITREGGAWLAITGSYGWLCSSRTEARREARWLARNRGYPVRVLP